MFSMDKPCPADLAFRLAAHRSLLTSIWYLSIGSRAEGENTPPGQTTFVHLDLRDAMVKDSSEVVRSHLKTPAPWAEG